MPTRPRAPSVAPTAGSFAPPCSIFRRHLKRVGLKYTSERADTLDAALAFEGTFDAERLLASLPARGHRVSKATVYRTLKLLVESGILAERPDARHCVRYEVVHGKPPVNVEVRRADGSRISLHDDRVARAAAEVARRSGIVAGRHVLIIEDESAA